MSRTAHKRRYGWIAAAGLFLAPESAQALTTVSAGGFTIQFWDQADGDANVLSTTIVQANLGTWTAAERTAVVRAFQYWTDRMNVPGATGQSPIIRVAKDESQLDFNAFATFDVTSTTASVTTQNTYNRLVNGANPARVDGIDGAIVFEPGQTFGNVNAYGTDRVTQLITQEFQLERQAIHEIGHSLGMSSVNDPHTDNVVGNTATGPNAQAVHGGGGVPLASIADPAHTNLTYHNLTRAMPLGESFRNIPFFAPGELALYADMGYTGLVLSDNFGRAYYQDGTLTPESNVIGFSSGEDYGVGLFLHANSRVITQNANLSASGFAGTGIRFSDTSNSTVIIAPGVTIAANGQQGIGVLASAGESNTLVHRGTISASGTSGRGIVVDFGLNALSNNDEITSNSFEDPLIRTMDITGSISAATNAIEIGDTASVELINIMNGASISGDIENNGLVNPGDGLVRTSIIFGRQANAGGRAIANSSDSAFNFAYAGDIFGSTDMTAALVGGTTSFSGSAHFESLDIQAPATLAGSGTVGSNQVIQHSGAIAPGPGIATLTLNGDVYTDGGTFEVDINSAGNTPGVNSDQVAVTGSSTIDNGSTAVNAAPGVYTPGTVYTFLTAGNGLTVGTPLTFTDNVADREFVGMFDGASYSFFVLRDVMFGELGETFNQMAVGGYLDDVIPNGSPEAEAIRDVLNLLPNDADVLDALDQMSGEIVGATLGFEAMSITNLYSMLSDHSLRACEPGANREDGWYYLTYGAGGSAEADGNARDANVATFGQVLGYVSYLDDDVALSSAYIFDNSRVQIDSLRSSGEVEAHRGIVQLTKGDRDDYLLLALMGGGTIVDTRRNVQFGPLNDFYTADHSGWNVGSNVGAGVTHQVLGVDVQTFAALQYFHIGRDGAVEAGAGPTALAFEANDYDSVRSQLGASLSLLQRGPTRVDLDTAWLHEYADTTPYFTGALRADTSASYTAAGVDMGRDWLMIGPTARVCLRRNVSLFANYRAMFNDVTQLHTGAGGVEASW